MRVLVLAMNVPFPPVGGARMRNFHLARALAEAHEVTVAGFAYDEEPPEPPPFPAEVVTVPWREPNAYAAMGAGDPAATELLESGEEPWFSSILDAPELGRTIERLARACDITVIEEADMARFLPSLPPGLPVVLDLHNVYSARNGDDEQRTLAFERRAVAGAALCLTCSAADAALARDLLGAEHVEVVPNGVDTSYFEPSAAAVDPGSLLFTGLMDYGPNVAAVQWFVREVLPLLPDAIFHVVGARPAPEVASLASERVVVHGAVPDMRPYLARAEQVVVPLLEGGGTRLKILEAAAAGKPIVTTSAGVAGLDFTAGEELLVADGAEAFASAVQRLGGDPSLRDELGGAARRRARAYEWAAIGERFRGLVESVVAPA